MDDREQQRQWIARHGVTRGRPAASFRMSWNSGSEDDMIRSVCETTGLLSPAEVTVEDVAPQLDNRCIMLAWNRRRGIM